MWAEKDNRMYIGNGVPYIRSKANRVSYCVKTIPYQWQKSLETTQIVSCSAKYGAKSSPKNSSLSLLIAPTRIGTILISLLKIKSCKFLTYGSYVEYLLLKHLSYVWEMHFNVMFIFVCFYIHITEVARIP